MTGRFVMMQRVARRLAWLAWVLSAVLVAGLVPADPAHAGRPWRPPAPKDVAGVPVVNRAPAAGRAAWTADKAVLRGSAPVAWPAPGVATVDLPAAPTQPRAADGADRSAPVRAGNLPVTLRRGPGAGPGRVAVRVHDRAAAVRAGRDVLVSVEPVASARSGAVSVGLSYASFARAYGGDYAARLRLAALPACVLSTPQRAECRRVTPLPSRNDPTTSTVTADVAAAGPAMVLTTMSAPASDNGDYSATGLSAAGTWQVSTQTGAFSWSIPLRMPPSLGGPGPSVSLAYSSGSVDGRTGTSNNQGGWIGDGWDSWPGFIERTYASCADDNPDHKTGDKCWFNDNATLSLNGHAGELIRDGSVWRLKNDDGTKVQRVAGDSGRDNGDDDNEYWKVTTTDGWQYFFGYHRLPGWSTGKPVTNSTWTLPVYGNNTSEPCHEDTFAASRCDQAWRWNLDYVVDPHSNTMAYFYSKETGAYGRDNTPTLRTTYDRGGFLDHIDYGMRYGAEYAQAAPLRVQFATAERCLSGCWSGAAWTSDPVTAEWPDTPWDQYCQAEPCTDQGSPTFWSARRLTKVTTRIRNGTTTYADVESWTLRHEFLNAGTVEGTPMWLRGITHAGHVTTAGGAAVTDPEIVFDPGSDPLPNRVDGPDDGRTALNRWRIRAITTESGGQILVTYSPISDCSRANPPNPATNTTRCMPAYYSPPGTGDPILDWFHKYVVTRVDVDDLVTDQPNMTTFYDYLDDPAWHYNTDEITKDKYRTWGDWRGYGRVRVRQGDATGAQTAVEYRFLRGMDGDRLNTSGGAKDVWVGDSWGGTIEDHEALNGFELQQIRFNGPTGAEVDSTRNEPWKRGPTATRTRNGVTTNAWMVDTGTVRKRTALADGGHRYTKTTTGFNNDGLPVTVDDFGDENRTGDETCTRTTYARNNAIWMIDKAAQIETLSGTCAAATTPAQPSTVLARDRTFYDTYVDESSFGAAPTKGDVVRTEELDSWNGAAPVYARTASSTYDPNGRVLTATDALGATTTTTYTTANGGLVTATTARNHLQHEVVTVKEPAWDLPVKTTDPNGLVLPGAEDAHECVIDGADVGGVMKPRWVVPAGLRR